MAGTHVPYSSIELSSIPPSASHSTNKTIDSQPNGSTSPTNKSGSPPSYNTTHRSTSFIIRSLVAGGIAGCAAKTAVAPLDRVKILFQASNPSVRRHEGSLKGIFRAMRDIHGQHGIYGLFQGHLATVLRIFPYAAIKFMAFEQYKAIIVSTHTLNSGSTHFVAGSLAGLTSVLFTYPLDLLRTRMAYEIERPLGVLAMSRVIYREQNKGIGSGIRNFYRGFFPTLMGMVPYAGISFWSNSVFIKACRDFVPEYTTLPADGNNLKRPLRGWAELACGGIAGAISQTLSYPLEVVRRRMQVSVAATSSRPNIREVMRQIYRQKGLRGFYTGLSIGYIKVTPMTAISFYTYAQMKHILNID